MAIEKCYGVLKRRFPLLSFGLRFRDVAVSANCIVVAAMLHNICIQNRDAHFDGDDISDPDRATANVENNASNQNASSKRNEIMEQL